MPLDHDHPTVAEEALAPIVERGVDTMFTLNGGHVWPLYEAARNAGLRVVDTRHEQTAVWAAEGWAKLNRRPGLAVLTAGPGVTNGVSAFASAHFNGSPLVVLGGRAPERTWGLGALQELDHVPILSPLAKRAVTIGSGPVREEVAELVEAGSTPHRGPVFADIPMDVLFSTVLGERPRPDSDPKPDWEPADGPALESAISALRGSNRPGLVVGSDVYWGEAEADLVGLVEEFAIPCFANGMGRGILPESHPLSFGLARGVLRRDADVVIVVGTRLDFRLGYGRFGSAQVIHLVDSVEERSAVPGVITVVGDIARALQALRRAGPPPTNRREWLDQVEAVEREARAAEVLAFADDSEPIRSLRVLGELARHLASDAVIICDGGDFASYAGKHLSPGRPGCWLDTGPFGCLGNGLGYAIAARLARPSSQVVVVMGDGAAGFSLMDVDTLVRHRLPVVIVIGNNGIWGLEKHPMEKIYGWSMACDLLPGTRYDEVVRALGGAGEMVTQPSALGPALGRAFAADAPYLINVVTDPADGYPRSSPLS